MAYRAARGWTNTKFLELAHRLDRDTAACCCWPSRVRPCCAPSALPRRPGQQALLRAGWSAAAGGAREVDAALVKKPPGRRRALCRDRRRGRQPSRSRSCPSALPRCHLCESKSSPPHPSDPRARPGTGHPVAGDRKLRPARRSRRACATSAWRMFLHSHSSNLPGEGEFRKLDAERTDDRRTARTSSAPWAGALEAIQKHFAQRRKDAGKSVSKDAPEK